MQKKSIILAVLVVTIAAGLYGLKEWYRTHDSTKSIKTDISITAEELFESYVANESEANNSFLEKTIEVTGVVKDVNTENNSTTVFLTTKDEMFGVACIFDGSDKISELPKKGSTVKIKGICSGITFDVVLNRCTIIN